jgi:hypothetical protein
MHAAQPGVPGAKAGLFGELAGRRLVERLTAQPARGVARGAHETAGQGEPAQEWWLTAPDQQHVQLASADGQRDDVHGDGRGLERMRVVVVGHGNSWLFSMSD